MVYRVNKVYIRYKYTALHRFRYRILVLCHIPKLLSTIRCTHLICKHIISHFHCHHPPRLTKRFRDLACAYFLSYMCIIKSLHKQPQTAISIQLMCHSLLMATFPYKVYSRASDFGETVARYSHTAMGCPKIARDVMCQPPSCQLEVCTSSYQASAYEGQCPLPIPYFPGCFEASLLL